MGMALTLRTRFTLVGVVVAGLVGLVACTTDDNDPGAETDGSGGTTSTNSGSGGSGGSGGGGTSTGKCAVAIPLDSSTPGIATFDDYDGSADLSTWSFPLGGDAARGVFAGPFGYGDETTGQPEAFAMVDGNDSTYALSISDSDSQEYGGDLDQRLHRR